MQIVFEDKDEENNSRRTSSMGPLIYARRISRCIEGKCNKRIRDRRNGIRDYGGIFNSFEKGIQWRREGISEGSRVKEAGARRENDVGIHTRVQESGKR